MIYIAIVMFSLAGGVMTFCSSLALRNFSLVLLLAGLGIIFSCRDPYAFPDYYAYRDIYEQLSHRSVFSIVNVRDLAFLYFMKIFNWIGVPQDIFFKYQPVIYYMLLIMGYRIIDNGKYISFFSFFVLTAAFVFLFHNVIRQGLASIFLLISIGLYLRGFSKLSLASAIFSIMSHVTVLPLYFAYLLLMFRVKMVFYLLVLAPFLSVVVFFVLSLESEYLPQKVVNFIAYGYENNLVYARLLMLYSVLVYLAVSAKKLIYGDLTFRVVYMFSVVVCLMSFLTLPVLLASSRYIYYSSILMPVLIVYYISMRRDGVNSSLKVLLLTPMVVLFGLLVYSFSSVKTVMGIG